MQAKRPARSALEALEWPRQARQQARCLLVEDVAMAAPWAARQIEQGHVPHSRGQAHGEKLEAALVDAQQGLTAPRPTELATGNHQTPSSSSRRDPVMLADRSRSSGTDRYDSSFVLLQAGVNQAVVELDGSNRYRLHNDPFAGLGL